MTREELKKVEDIIYRYTGDPRQAARAVLSIRQELKVSADASRPGYAGSSGGMAYVSQRKV